MKNRLSAFLLILSLLCLCACGSPSQSSSPASTPVPTAEPEPSEAVTTPEPGSSQPEAAPTEAGYAAIYEEYAQKLQEATPGLIAEYQSEAAENNSGLEGLAVLCNKKNEELAKISNDGVQKMAQYMMFHGSGNYGEYEEWSMKLYDVYMEESQKITDAYMSSVTG